MEKDKAFSLGASGKALYSYQKSEPGVWMVGQFRDDGSWEQESKWNTQEEAAEHAHALNGNVILGESTAPRAENK